MIRALLLDAAGTLIEPAEPVASVYARVSASHGLAISEQAIRSSFREVFTGLPDPAWDLHPEGDQAEREWWKQVVEKTLTIASGQSIDPATVHACFDELFAYYEEPAAWLVFPEVREVLTSAWVKGWKCAVVSNFDRRLHRILAGHGLEFDAVVTSADAKSRKPDSAIFLHVLKLLGLSADEVVHAGDSPSADVEGAAALKIRCFLVDRPHSDLRGLITLAESL